MVKPFKLEKPYITKKIEPTAFKTALGSTYQTAYRLYLITSGIKEIQSFFECSHDKYFVIAHIKTEAAAAGEARQQIWSVKHLQPILTKKPRYILKCDVTDKQTNRSIYRSEVVSINPDVIYEQAQICIDELKQILA